MGGLDQSMLAESHKDDCFTETLAGVVNDVVELISYQWPGQCTSNWTTIDRMLSISFFAVVKGPMHFNYVCH